MMNIDTEIRHVTKPGANIFLELGFGMDEAERLKAELRRQIDEQISAGDRIRFKGAFARDGRSD